MILVKLNDFPPTAGLEHVTTSFRLYRDKGLKLLVDEQLNSKNKNIYFNPMNLPKDVVFYLKYTRHFNESGADIDGDIIEVYDNGEQYSNMLLNEDVVVDEPTIHFNIDQIRTQDEFVVETSTFRGNYGGHEYTNWVIMDSLDQVLFASIRDKDNLTSITVQNNEDLMNKTTLKFVASHGTMESVESKPAIFVVRNGAFNFEIVSSLYNVKAFTDLAVKFSVIDIEKPMGITKIKIVDTISGEVYQEGPLEGNTYTIPWFLLREAGDLYMVISAYDDIGAPGEITKKIRVNPYRESMIKNPAKVYERKLSKAYRTNISIANNVTTGVMNNKLIGIPHAESLRIKLYDYDLAKHEFKDLKKNVDGITLENRNLEGFYMVPFNTDYLLIDAFNTKGQPTFYIYRYSQHYDTYTLNANIVRSDETKCIGMTNAIVQLTSGFFIYAPVGAKKLKRLDVNLKTITDEVEVPFEDPKSTQLMRLNNNRVLLKGASTYHTKVYDWHHGLFTEGTYIQPRSFIEKDTKIQYLDSGDSFIYKCNLLNDPDDVQDPSIIYYRLGSEGLSETGCRFNHLWPTTTIRLENGEVVMCRYDEDTTGIRSPRPEFGTSGTENEDGTENGSSSTVDPNFILPGELVTELDPESLILIVSDGEKKSIQDPYKYDRIIIRGKGVLSWVAKNQPTKTFTSADCIVTRTTEFDQKKFAEAKFQTITILEGATVSFVDTTVPETPEGEKPTTVIVPNALPGEIVPEDERNPKVLIVNDKQRKVVADPYAFDRIIVRGSGVLVWNNNGNRREFTSKDCIITKTSSFNNEAFNAAGFQTLTILDFAEVTFTDEASTAEQDPDYVRPDNVSSPTYTIHYEFR